MTPIQQAIAILEEDALTNRIERALEVLRGVPQSPALRMCGLCHTWNSKPCGEQCALQITDPTFEQMAFANAAESAALADTRPDRK